MGLTSNELRAKLKEAITSLLELYDSYGGARDKLKIYQDIFDADIDQTEQEKLSRACDRIAAEIQKCKLDNMKLVEVTRYDPSNSLDRLYDVMGKIDFIIELFALPFTEGQKERLLLLNAASDMSMQLAIQNKDSDNLVPNDQIADTLMGSMVFSQYFARSAKKVA